MSQVKQLPIVGRIQGAVLEPGPSHRESAVLVQYTDPNKELYELRMPLLDAMYLLNVLRAVEHDAGFESQNRQTGRKGPMG